MTPTINLDELKLLAGGHQGPTPDSGACVMEVVAYVAGEPWSDHPACVSPVLGAFLRSWNDGLGDDDRQKLKPYIERVIGTADDGRDTERAYLAADWLVRVCAPAFLDLAGLADDAARLRGLAPLTGPDAARTALPLIRESRDSARAYRRAKREEFIERFKKAAWAAWAAGAAEAAEAAWAAWAAGAAEAAGAAWAAEAAEAAWAAWAAEAAEAAWAAWAAEAAEAARQKTLDKIRAITRKAAEDKLAPTVTSLQASAFTLLDQMIGSEEKAA